LYISIVSTPTSSSLNFFVTPLTVTTAFFDELFCFACAQKVTLERDTIFVCLCFLCCSLYVELEVTLAALFDSDVIFICVLVPDGRFIAILFRN
jgi:hypothetical protein